MTQVAPNHGAVALGEILAEMGTGLAFRVIRFIGRGGMGEVYEVREIDTGRRLAMKCVRLGALDNPGIVARTDREGTVLKRLRHPNVVEVYATGIRADGLVWMVMKLLVGHTAGQLIRSMGRLHLPWALEIMRDVCRGLRAIHELAIHRDIKPENIHVDEEGTTRVLDLGAARYHERRQATTEGYTIGTVEYMSPEQLLGEDLDARSDLYSVSVVLYELLSGVHPLVPPGSEKDARAISLAILNRPVVPLRSIVPCLPGYVETITMRGLAKDARDRYADANEYAMTLTAALRRFQYDHGPLAPLRFLFMNLPPVGTPPSAALPVTAELPAARVAGVEEHVPLDPVLTDVMPFLTRDDEEGSGAPADRGGGPGLNGASTAPLAIAPPAPTEPVATVPATTLPFATKAVLTEPAPTMPLAIVSDAVAPPKAVPVPRFGPPPPLPPGVAPPGPEVDANEKDLTEADPPERVSGFFANPWLWQPTVFCLSFCLTLGALYLNRRAGGAQGSAPSMASVGVASAAHPAVAWSAPPEASAAPTSAPPAVSAAPISVPAASVAPTSARPASAPAPASAKPRPMFLRKKEPLPDKRLFSVEGDPEF